MEDPRLIIKQDLVPFLREMGFKGSFPHFRRIGVDRIDLLTFQFDKSGTGKFVVELAVAPPGDFTTYWGKVIPQGKLTAWDLNERLRLGSKSPAVDNWFELGKNSERVIDRILSLIRTQGNKFFEGKDS